MKGSRCVGWIVGFLIAAAAVAQEPPSGQDLADRIDAYVRPFTAAGQLSGTLLVARDGVVLYEKSFGMANYELGVPNTPATRFNVASVSKPMTAIIAHRYIERGKLALTDKLSKWIPDFPRADEITIDHLLRHRSGIPHRVVSDDEQTAPRTAAEMVEFAKRKGLTFAPGSQRLYSSGGYAVLARVLEIVGGRTFGQLLEEIVFAPAGAVHSLHPGPRRLIPGRAVSHFAGPDRPVLAPLKDLSFLVGGGSVYSTPRDLLAIQRALLAGVYGEPARKEIASGPLTWDGLTNGYRAFADYHPAQKLTVIFTGNLFTAAPEGIRESLPKIAAGEAVPPAEAPRIEPFVVPAALRQRYEGFYETGPGVLDEVRFAPEGNLVFIGEWILIPTSENTFFSPQDDAKVKVVVGKDGTAEALEWESTRGSVKFPRVKPQARGTSAGTSQSGNPQ